MSFAHIYPRKDGRFTARFRAAIAHGDLAGGTVECTSLPGAFDNEQQARDWISRGAKHNAIEHMPAPRVIRRSGPPKEQEANR